MSETTKNQSAAKKLHSESYAWLVRLTPIAVAFLAAFPYMVLTGRIDLAPNVPASSLKDFSAKVQFTLTYQILGLIWISFCMWLVIVIR